LFLIRAGDQSY